MVFAIPTSGQIKLCYGKHLRFNKWSQHFLSLYDFFFFALTKEHRDGSSPTLCNMLCFYNMTLIYITYRSCFMIYNFYLWPLVKAETVVKEMKGLLH